MMSDKQKTVRLTLGVWVGVVMMGISYLMDGYGMRETALALSLRPIWVYTLCMLLGMLGVPAMCWALTGWYAILCDVSVEKWTQRLFVAAAASYGISSLFLIAIDCLPPVAFQSARELGMTEDAALTLTQTMQRPFAVPILVFFLIENIGVSVVLWRLLLTGRLQLSKWAVLCCPVPMLLVDVLLKCIPLAITKDISVTLESFGWLLFMLAGLLHGKASKATRGHAHTE